MFSIVSTGCVNPLRTGVEKEDPSTVPCSDLYSSIGSAGRFLRLPLIPVHLLLEPLLVLYATRTLGMQPTILGLVLSLGSIGALLGALTSRLAVRRFGLGWTIVGVALLAGRGCLLFPLAAGPLVFAMPVLAAAQFLSGFSITMYNINQISPRQILVPARLQGRMNASIRFIIWGAIPIGLLCGGFLGEAIG